MTAGAAWACIAAVLKVKRGVNEVIATIMLNDIALSVIHWLFDEFFRDAATSDLNVKTKTIPTQRLDARPRRRTAHRHVHRRAARGASLYWLLVFKSRFGFRLRASGANAVAARTAGISSQQDDHHRRCSSRVPSPASSAMPSLLGNIHAYGPSIPDGLGFAGIAVALLGRNHPLGIVAAAFLFGFLDSDGGCAAARARSPTRSSTSSRRSSCSRWSSSTRWSPDGSTDERPPNGRRSARRSPTPAGATA